MGFEELLPDTEETRNADIAITQETTITTEKITQNHVYDIVTSKKADWQSIIYELINSEQLDPWDIDITILTAKYFEKILELEDQPDFYSTSKVILAASLLLKIKSDFLLNKHIKSIDEILFGKTETTSKPLERIEIDESELPILIPKTPMPRLRKVTLPELMEALNKAINTESRRIKREVQIKRAKKLSSFSIPKFKQIDLKDRIKEFYARILTKLKNQPSNKQQAITKTTFAELTKDNKDQKLSTFLPLLHLSNTRKLWLEQPIHLEDIHIYLYKYFEDNRNDFMKELEEDIEHMKEELENNQDQGENLDKRKSGLEIAREKQKEKKQLQAETKRELEAELGIVTKLAEEIADIEHEKKIEDVTGFSDE